MCEVWCGKKILRSHVMRAWVCGMVMGVLARRVWGGHVY